MDRRGFLKTAAAAGMAAWLAPFSEAYAAGTKAPAVGKPWKGWRKGEFQVHFIYTGVGEQMFMIFPDATTMLLDCGDHNAIGRGKLAVPVKPSPSRHAGEWVTRYVERVNPQGRDVDYMMLSHYHSDHGGCEDFHAGSVERGGLADYRLSGFSQAAETLRFGKAFDRCWPDYTEPIPLIDDGNKMRTHMSRFYDYMTRERGLTVERFRVGETNQVRMLRGGAAKYPGFSIFNLCGNGRIASSDGKVTDLYAGRIQREHPKRLNENGLSLGMVISYGPFRFYTAGDFSDSWKLADGSKFEVEDAIADVCGKVSVAKINHHGHYSMPARLVSALQARVYVSCVWDQLHNVAPVMERLADRSLYPGERIVCPGVFPRERREEDAGKPFLADIAPASFDCGHIVLNVSKGGRDYSVSYLTADDESMIVKSVMNFKA